MTKQPPGRSCAAALANARTCRPAVRGVAPAGGTAGGRSRPPARPTQAATPRDAPRAHRGRPEGAAVQAGEALGCVLDHVRKPAPGCWELNDVGVTRPVLVAVTDEAAAVALVGAELRKRYGAD